MGLPGEPELSKPVCHLTETGHWWRLQNRLLHSHDYPPRAPFPCVTLVLRQIPFPVLFCFPAEIQQVEDNTERTEPQGSPGSQRGAKRKEPGSSSDLDPEFTS